jgi:hypothetical protein
MSMSYYHDGYDACMRGVARDCNETDSTEWFDGYDDAEADIYWSRQGSTYRARGLRLSRLLDSMRSEYEY